MDNCFIGEKIWCPRTIVSASHASQRCWNRVGMCGVQQSASRLDHLDQRPCVSQHNNFIEIVPIPANYGRTFRARMVEIIPVEDPRCRCMHQRAKAKVDFGPSPKARPPISIKTEYGKVRSFAIPRQGQIVVRQIKRIRVVRTTDG